MARVMVMVMVRVCERQHDDSGAMVQGRWHKGEGMWVGWCERDGDGEGDGDSEGEGMHVRGHMHKRQCDSGSAMVQG